ncbi:hypothetical protein J2W32_002501 [Variovorax boronicumulans]|uniref:AbiTii domain-containing protein n=1 Tax=Variovorax boronicumulans TaxID=436515 RepID=A0AAW8D0F2_9BURK|nr:hypothetical protein [Variovorax boronicumulans]MDP9893433.1 hypothetical protein [Variovorax boronicumulans]MDQ0053453.1 hypothetical protein [Variovorax boronicumulans]
MNLDPSRRALDHLQQVRLLTDAEYAAATNDPELPNALFRTPAEALAWVVAREIVPQAQLPDLPTRAAGTGQENEAQAIVSEATDLISGEFPLPPWAQLHIRLLDRRVHDGVSATALDQLLALQLIDAAQHSHSLSMLPTHEEAWAAPDSLAATLAWTVLRAGALSADDLKALAGRTAHDEIVADAMARVAGARTEMRATKTTTTFSVDSMDFTTSSSSSTSSLPSVPFAVPPSSTSQTRTFTWTSSSASESAPGGWKNKLIGAVVIALIALIALYFLFGR